MKSLIIGFGEIGKSLYNVLRVNYEVDYLDRSRTQLLRKHYDIIHICIPYTDEFINEVEKYQEEFTPTYTIIHSTVPPEVYDSIDAISSPCLGIHPFLEESMKTFPKYLGGKNASEVADYFRRAGMKVYLVDNPKATAIMKILDTTLYGVCIEYTKDVKRQCEKYNIPFELWTVWTDRYNAGYIKLNQPEFVRPNLVPIMIGIKGHCVLPNLELLETPFTKFLKELNA